MAGETPPVKPTGVFFAKQSTSCLVDAILNFESHEQEFSPYTIREHSFQFDNDIFKARIAEFIGFAMQNFKNRNQITKSA